MAVPAHTLLVILATFTALLPLPLPANAGLQLDYADVPAPCIPPCRPVAELSGICDVDADFDDNNEEVEDLMKLQCLCLNPSFDVAGLTALCASCIAQNALPSDLDDNTDDVTEIMARCGFPSAVWTPLPTATARVEVVASRLTASAQITTTVDFAPRPTCTETREHGHRGHRGRQAVEARHWKHGGEDDETEEEDMAGDTNSTKCFVPGERENDDD